MSDMLKHPLEDSRRILSRLNPADVAENRDAVVSWLRRLPELRNLISTQIYLAFAGAVALTIAGSLIGWYSFDRVGNFQSRVNEGSVPDMSAAFGMAQHANTLVSAAPRLTTTTNPEDFNRVAAGIGEANVALVGQLALLQGQNTDNERFARMRAHVDSLTTNIHIIQNGMSQSFPVANRLVVLQEDILEVGSQLDEILFPSIDDQLFYAMTGYRNLGESPEPRAQHLSEKELAHYRHLAELQANANTATQILQSAFGLSDAASIEPLRERIETAEGRVQRNLAALEELELLVRVEPLLERLFELGIGEQGALGLLYSQLRIVERQRELLEQNRGIAVELLDEVDVFVGITNANVEEAALASGQAVLTGKILLAALSVISVAGAVLIAWLFVGRVLLHRIEMLSVWMRRMAGGDLEARVELGGRDEVADMAAALEVFRRHAIEVQRLNLVERLAEDLQDKNDELEGVLDDLRRAQDQIVARDKLAALGELTAGVAHEIRNPLNFVKNFSEASEELLIEMQEIMDEGGGTLNEKQRELVNEISEDLTANLDRIRTHGNRADRIVHDMLMMGRGGSEHQPTDINRLLDEHSRLAYHSARATDLNFQIDLRHDFDPAMGEVPVIPQDIGRVFLNMVSNAGYATDEKRRAFLESETGAGEDYSPVLWLSTRRKEDSVEIRIRDNGNGIPPDVVDKIFNPFFTTKPTNQGTGLGLAMSNDIVRQHGGTIEVDTEPGQYTEMVVELPLEPPSVPVESLSGSS